MAYFFPYWSTQKKCIEKILHEPTIYLRAKSIHYENRWKRFVDDPSGPRSSWCDLVLRSFCCGIRKRSSWDVSMREHNVILQNLGKHVHNFLRIKILLRSIE